MFNESRPHALGLPHLLQIDPRQRVIGVEHFTPIAIKKSGNSIVRDAMDMYWESLQLHHSRAELGEVVVSWVLKINWYMDIRHSKTAYAGRLIR